MSEERTKLNRVSGSVMAARRISVYLTLGMHHSTREAQMKISEIIDDSNQIFDERSENLSAQIRDFLSQNDLGQARRGGGSK